MKAAHQSHETSPLSYRVRVGHVSANPITVKIEAAPDELERLAETWKVLAVRSLKSEIQIARWKKDGVLIKGRVQAEIEQACVVTLEPVPAKIDETFEQIFLPEGSKLARVMLSDTAEMVLDPDGPDLPEVFVGDTIDAGEVIAEAVALAIEPYPRKKGIEFEEHIEGDASGPAARPSPFAVLKDWKKED
ncbi:MAG: YceD family protein [Pseudorhizobium sp.]